VGFATDGGIVPNTSLDSLILCRLGGVLAEVSLLQGRSLLLSKVAAHNASQKSFLLLSIAQLASSVSSPLVRDEVEPIVENLLRIHKLK
jgi:hypothetical protein